MASACNTLSIVAVSLFSPRLLIALVGTDFLVIPNTHKFLRPHRREKDRTLPAAAYRFLDGSPASSTSKPASIASRRKIDISDQLSSALPEQRRMPPLCSLLSTSVTSGSGAKVTFSYLVVHAARCIEEKHAKCFCRDRDFQITVRQRHLHPLSTTLS